MKKSSALSADYLIEGCDSVRRLSEKTFQAITNGIPRIDENTLYAIAGTTLEEFREEERRLRIQRRIDYETSYTGKLERLRAQAVAVIGLLGNAMVIPSESARIYVHYKLKERDLAALVKCISSHGVAFNDRNGKSVFLEWDKVDNYRLMQIADYFGKGKKQSTPAFLNRLISLEREEEKRVKENKKLSA